MKRFLILLFTLLAAPAYSLECRDYGSNNFSVFANINHNPGYAQDACMAVTVRPGNIFFVLAKDTVGEKGEFHIAAQPVVWRADGTPETAGNAILSRARFIDGSNISVLFEPGDYILVVSTESNRKSQARFCLHQESYLDNVWQAGLATMGNLIFQEFVNELTGGGFKTQNETLNNALIYASNIGFASLQNFLSSDGNDFWEMDAIAATIASYVQVETGDEIIVPFAYNMIRRIIQQTLQSCDIVDKYPSQ